MTGPANDPAAAFRSGFVSLIGKANVGKSTLLNACVGERVSIATPTPQTTRERLLGIVTQARWQIVFVDTPGFQEPRRRLDQLMRRATFHAIQDVDLIVVVLDARTGIRAPDQAVLDAVKRANRAAIVAINKTDAVKKPRLLPIIDACRAVGVFRDFVPVSAETGDQIPVLLEVIATALPAGPAWYAPAQRTDQTHERRVREQIREQVILHTRQEVPHAVAVVVDDWSRRRDGRGSHIRATIVVERDTQKAIVIGRGGSMLRRIGQAARQTIETLLGESIYLELWVKVLPGWRNDDQALRRLGYTAGDA